MADFVTALDGALRAWYKPARGVQRPSSHAQGRTARMAALERAYGSKKAAAAAAGIGGSTWRAWSTKGQSHRAPSGANAAKLDAAYDALLRAIADRRRRTPTLMVISAVVVADPKKSAYKNKTEHREFKAEKGGAAADAANAWVRGESPEAVAAAALAAIKAGYGIEFAFEGMSR